MKPIKENKYQEAYKILREWLEVSENEELYNAKHTIQELIDNYECLHNEFCLRCGNYKESHLGKCDGCRWKED